MRHQARLTLATKVAKVAKVARVFIVIDRTGTNPTVVEQLNPAIEGDLVKAIQAEVKPSPASRRWPAQHRTTRNPSIADRVDLIPKQILLGQIVTSTQTCPSLTIRHPPTPEVNINQPRRSPSDVI